MGFLDRWAEKPGYKRDWRKLSRRTIKTDKWDEQDLERILEQMKDFERARDRLCETVDTGNAATGDTFFSFFKDEPRNIDTNKIRPDYWVNAMVRDELQGMTEYEELKALGTVGDDVNSALAFITMKDDLETVFDRLEKEQELAKELSQQLSELDRLEAEAKTVDQLLDEMHKQDEPDEDQIKDLQDQQQQNQQQQEALQQQAQAAADQLEQSLESKRGQVQQGLRKGLDKAKEQAQTMEGIDQTWGTEPGALQRLGADKRLELANRIKNNRKLKRLSELVGPMKRVAFGEQRKKADHARDEIYNVEKGADMSRVLPQELMFLHHPQMKKLFYRNIADEALLQYELKGEERLGLGGIICCIDSSGSMQGDPEIWAKAVGLSLLHMAKAQKRSFLGMHFGSAPSSWSDGELIEFPFEKPGDYDLDRIFEFAEFFFGGGTDFQMPLTAAVKHLRAEYERDGKVKGDVVFITDGSCNVSDTWFEDFKREQEELGFQVFGVHIPDGYSSVDTLSRICDGKVATIKSLTSPDDVRDIFGQIHSS